MKKQERRAQICVFLALLLTLGAFRFIYKYVKEGRDWVTFYGNTQIYNEGVINRGTVTDRNGTELLTCTREGYYYNEDYETRVSTIHAVGDVKGNVPTGAISRYKSQLIGYDLLNGTFDITADGKKIVLTLDAGACKTAYEALDGRTGTVGVYNWKTGEIVCMVSTPSFDPNDPPSDNSEREVGSYFFNNFIDGTITPGSTFKLITAAAVIDNIPDRDSFIYECDGINKYGDSKDLEIRDVYAHGTVDFRDALAQSCNGAFGLLTRELGASIMEDYTEKTGLTQPIDINGIKTAAGSFNFPTDDDYMLSWAGIGQGEDLVNPCAMMVYMGAIANEGKPECPTLIKHASFLGGVPRGESLGRYLEKDTALELKGMMKNNVVSNYGEDNFYGLDIYAKSGTAETSSEESDAWFVGFTDDKDAPYAFVVWVKGGGFGSEVAAPIARSVLDKLREDI